MSDLYLTAPSQKPHRLPLLLSLIVPYTYYCCAMQPICVLLLLDACICAKLLHGTCLGSGHYRSMPTICACHCNPLNSVVTLCINHQLCAVMDIISSSASHWLNFWPLMQQTYTVEAPLLGMQRLCCELACETLGLMSLGCRCIHNHQACTVAGTMHLGVQSTGQSGPCCHQTSAVKSHLQRMKTLCWILRI